MFAAPISNFNRPDNGTAYAQNELVANDVDAADVIPLKWSVENVNGCGKIVAVRLFTDDETVTNANFDLYLFRSAPTPGVGDNAGFSVASYRDVLGVVALDLTSGALVSATDKAKRIALTTPIVFQVGNEQKIYGLLATATGAAYDPDADELFEITLEIEG